MMDKDMDMRRLVSLLSNKDQIELTCTVSLSRFTEMQSSIKLFFQEFQGILPNLNANSDINSEEQNQKVLVEFSTDGIL